MNKLVKIGLIVALPLALTGVISAETKKPKKSTKNGKSVIATAPRQTSVPVVPPADIISHKRNERPSDASTADPGRRTATYGTPVFFYEFSRPGFTYSKVQVEHDEGGKGRILFHKDGLDEPIADPVSLSTTTLSKINDSITALNFLASTEEYQHSRDYSHMGNTVFTMKKNGKERSVKFNWTDNKHAKALMDEYRKIGNEYTWRFEISVARENQPLLTPGLMDAIDDYLKRNEISDPAHLKTFLTELSTDERLPLMARNRALKIIKEIEKKK